MCLLPSKKHSVVIGGTRPAGTGVTIWLGKTLITEKVLVRKYVYKSCHISSHSTPSTSGGGKSASRHPDNMVGQNSLDCSWFTFTFMINAFTAKAAAEKTNLVKHLSQAKASSEATNSFIHTKINSKTTLSIFILFLNILHISDAMVKDFNVISFLT